MDMAETAGRNGKPPIDKMPLCQFIVEIQEVLEYERSSYLGKN